MNCPVPNRQEILMLLSSNSSSLWERQVMEKMRPEVRKYVWNGNINDVFWSRMDELLQAPGKICWRARHKFIFTWSWEIRLVRRVGHGDLQRSLPASTILWFCDLSKGLSDRWSSLGPSLLWLWNSLFQDGSRLNSLLHHLWSTPAGRVEEARLQGGSDRP